ncbi:MAG: methyl-accepting chemotaxis protein [Oscillospiraceae bacterium]|nr:methyl-accepting chemotaxis protein [Oscillospiraceae bacterium]
MKSLFTFKKLSAQLTFIIGAFVIIVGALIAIYMQTRIITEIGNHTTVSFQYQAETSAGDCNVAYFKAETPEIASNTMIAIVSQVHAYETGVALLKNTSGEFYDTGPFAARLSAADKAALSNAAIKSNGDTFEVELAGVTYLAASSTLYNGYEIYFIVPKREVNADLYASLMRFVIIFVTVATIVVFLASFAGKKIARPLAALSGYMRRVGSTGNIMYTAEEERALEVAVNGGGEIGQLVDDCGVFIDHLIKAADEMKRISDGDLTVDIKTLSDTDIMGVSMQKMISNFNEMFREINSSSVMVSSGSKQIADGSQNLAQGSTEQASSIEELSSSVAEIAKKTELNAEKAGTAAALADSIRGNAERGSRQMSEMVEAVKEIDQAGQNISKVIKVIDDIAFQTNILALNAAVEAARAGSHGKGFAVVAEEVRNLASKSAEAAKDTGAMIQNSITKAETGVRIATETSESLAEIVSGINESNRIILEIVQSSNEQTGDITHINNGIEQVAQVVQQNSATAQQSAASAEEISGQTVILEELISKFKLKR